MKNSIACLNYRLKLNDALKNRINDLPRFLLPSSQSAPASQLPHLTSCLPSELPGSLTTVSLFIYSSLSSGQRAGGGSCLHSITHTDFPLLWWRNQSTFSRLGDGNLDSLLSVQGCCGWCRLGTWWGRSSSCSLAQIGDERLNEHFQGVTGIASLSGWP